MASTDSGVSSVAMLVGGMLTASGDLSADLTVKDVSDVIGPLLGPSTMWSPTPHDAQEPDAFAATTEPPAGWRAPDEALLARVSDVLDRGWADEIRRQDGPAGTNVVLRLMTYDTSDAESLHAVVAPEGLTITTFTPTALGDWCWRWPLRIGVAESLVTPDGSPGLGDVLDIADYCDVQTARDDVASFDILVLPSDDTRVRPGSRMGAVVIVGHDATAGRDSLASQLARGEEFGPGAVIATPGDDVSWLSDLIRTLAEGHPLDVAVGLVRPDAAIEGDPSFFAATSLPNWARLAAVHAIEAGRLDLGASLQSVAYDFDDNSARTAGRAVAFDRDGFLELQGGSQSRSRGRDYTDSGDGSFDGGGRPPEPEHEGQLPDTRRLVARVTEPDGTVRVTGFLAGRNHHVRLRIADAADVDEIGADAPLESPAGGRSVDLDVFVVVQGSTARPQALKIRYPARGNGPWSDAFVVRAPRSRPKLTVLITVFYEGRAIQSATLTGPVTATPDDGDGDGITLSVDVSSAHTSGERHGADATFVEVDDPAGEPIVYDAASGGQIPAEVLAESIAGVRRELIDTFLSPPPTLVAAAAPLARLAIRGCLLREALFGMGDRRFANASWIHVTSFGGSTVPFELIYEHEMPIGEPVAVCAPAVSGAKECAADCPDRSRDDRVCPFGFWGTTKVVERRKHSAGRRDGSASDQRLVPARAGGVVGVAPQASADDPDAGTRIAAAVQGFVQTGTGVVVDGWTSLEDAVAAGPNLLCLVTHTIPGADPDDDLAVKLELGTEKRPMVAINRRCINPSGRQPGPIVLALGCDTATIHASFATFVSRLHGLGAEIVVSAVAQIPGREVADFVERLMAHLADELAKPGEHRFGAVLTAARRETLCDGDVLALALTASGDGDVRIGGS